MLTHRHDTIIGDIPDDWQPKPLRSLLKKQFSGDWGSDEGEQAVSVLRSTNFTSSGALDFRDVATRYFNQAKAEAFGLQKGDLLVERSGGGPDQPVGRIGFIVEDISGGTVSNFVQVLRPDPKKVDPEFLGWVLYELQRTGIIERVQQQSTQMRNLNWRDYQRLLLPWPEPTEQRRIAVALKLADDAIAKAKAELEATRELKRSLMRHLFVNGIPTADKKQLTIIGELPARWALKKGRELFKLFGSKAGEPAEIDQMGDCHYLKVDDFNSSGNEREILNAKIRFQRAKNPGYPIYAAGCIVFAKRGAALLKDRVRILGADSMIDPNLMVMECNQKIISTAFMYHYLIHFRLGRLCEDAGIPQLNNRDLYPKYFPIPEKSEQIEIVRVLDIADENVSLTFKKVEALHQVKKSLLQNLLTGKIRIPPESE